MPFFFFLKNLRHRYLAPKYLSILWCLLPRDRLSSHALDPHPSSENSIKHATSFLYFLILLCTSVFKHIQGLSFHGLVKTNKLKINTSHPSFTPPSRAAVFIAFLAVFLPSNKSFSGLYTYHFTKCVCNVTPNIVPRFTGHLSHLTSLNQLISLHSSTSLASILLIC